MFNTTTNKSSVDIKNPATGIIQRSCDDSFFSLFHQTSERAKELFNPFPKYDDKEVFVIQVMLMSDGRMLAELVFKNYSTPSA